jgi:hypothetical protein
MGEKLSMPESPVPEDESPWACFIALANFSTGVFRTSPWLSGGRRLGLKELPNAGEAQHFLCTPDGVGRPRFFLFFIRITISGSDGAKKLRLLQVVEIFANLTGCKQPSNCGAKRR